MKIRASQKGIARPSAQSSRAAFEINWPGSAGGFFLLAARFNHSCRPNVHHFWVEEIGAEVMHACRWYARARVPVVVA